ncbi:Gfo/Idh/MocA family protein [Paenibacillus sabuli]|uniref:Gfo/Idh/MocA family protein n=1 Tax=Paenibacillus sabuli TaxID=2772509 RepID=UPI00295C1FA8|nr:Gfo/Idh/MocA family oxidoreductase [Paenibacillus sabuli]
MSASYRIAIIGGGIIAASHLEAMAALPDAQACAIADIRSERAKELAEAYGIAAYVDYETMLREQRPDIAIVTLPHHLHEQASVFAFEQGCHVLLEKPMALNTAQCEVIAAAARAAGRTLAIAHTQHYYADNAAARAYIRSGELGRLVMINVRRHLPYDKPERPDWFFERAKAGGGILTNLGAHCIDKIQWLTGEPLVRVHATMDYALGRGDVEGSGAALCHTASGIPAVICQSGYPGAPIDETELHFTRGSLRLRTGLGLWISDGGDYAPVQTEQQEPTLVLQLRNLLTALEQGAEPQEADAEYARSVVAAVEALYRSAACGQAVEVNG